MICDLPLLVDIDTGWGTEGTIARTIRELERVDVAAVHIEDQVSAKRCGHRPGKQVVDTLEMAMRIQAAVDARRDPNFVIMARTDAVAVEGLSAAITRCQRYVQAGADMIFAEALTSLDDYKRFTSEVPVPVLANMTEFGKSPLLDIDTLRSVGIRMVLYPLTAFRAMNEAARFTYETIRRKGTQADLIKLLQTRDELYDLLGYLQAEQESHLGRSSI